MKYAISEDTIKKFEDYIKTIIDVDKLDCEYNPDSQKCKNCVKAKVKYKYTIKNEK